MSFIKYPIIVFYITLFDKYYTNFYWCFCKDKCPKINKRNFTEIVSASFAHDILYISQNKPNNSEVSLYSHIISTDLI